ncbi:MAG: glycosyltransferase [Elusimicrobia bacterium]|nr:glycosyltransferase [Elusimicrobiota bacterium]
MKPQVSVIVASRNSRATLGDCLASLRDQKTARPFETIVVDSSTDGADRIAREQHPAVKLFHFKERLFVGDARNFGVAQADAPVVAFLDADCRAPADWVERVAAAHEQRVELAIGGSVTNGNPESRVGWAAYFTEFTRWLPAGEARPMADIAGTGMSYKKRVFKDVGPLLKGTYCSDTEFHWRLARVGQTPLFDPSLRVAHHNLDRVIPLLTHEFHHGLSFARVRCGFETWPFLKRAMYAAAFGPMAAVLFARAARRAWIAPGHGAAFVKAAPLTALGFLFWSLGEAFGYGLGARPMVQEAKNKLWGLVKTLVTRRLVITFDKMEFEFRDLPAKKLFNWALDEASYYLGFSRALSWPTHMQLEPSNLCNLRCPVCHVVTDGKPQGFLKMEDFKRLVDEMGDYLLFIQFWGWGEPFLNKDFLDMVRYGKTKGIQFITSTNGHFFETNEDVDRLIDSGLDALIFAVDGLEKETYEKYRKQGDYDRVLAGLRRLVQRKRERGADRPIVNLRMLMTRDTEGQVSGMMNRASELGVDIFTLKTINEFDNEAGGRPYFPENIEYHRFRYDSQGQPIRIENLCKKPWNHPVVYRDGTVVPCDYYTGREFNLGNAFGGSTMEKVWFGPAFRSFRKLFGGGSPTRLRCDTCCFNYAELSRCVSHAFPIPPACSKNLSS